MLCGPGVHCAGLAFVVWVWRADVASIMRVFVMGHAGICHGSCWCLSCGCGVGMVLVVWVWCLSCGCGVHRLGVAFVALVFVVGCAGLFALKKRNISIE